MLTKRFSCFTHQLSVDSPPFDNYNYSAFKYGSYRATRLAAEKMDHLLAVNFPDAEPDNWRITSAAFKHVPTASTLLTHQLNLCRRDQMRFNPIHLKREFVYPEDYAKLSPNDRDFKQNEVFISLNPVDINGKKLIVVDDAYVTGAHERNITKYVRDLVSELYFVYLVDLSQWPSADIESKINYSAINSILDVLMFIKEGNYSLNARTIKYLLSYPDQAAFEYFLSEISNQLLIEIYEYAILDGYAFMQDFSKNMGSIRKLINEKKLLKSNSSFERTAQSEYY